MKNVKIPNFLKPKPNDKACKFSILREKYEEKFGKTWSTEEFGIKESDLENIFEICLRENRSFYDVIGISPEDLDVNDEF